MEISFAIKPIYDKGLIQQPSRILQSVIVVFISVTLFACSSENVSDLQTYVQETKSRKKGSVPPLPEVQIYDTYTYNQVVLRDPFTPTVKRQTSAKSNNGIKPDLKRPRQVLEQFPLDTLRLVGSLELKGKRWALIKGGDGTIHRTKKGKYMGQDNGRIVKVTESEIVLLEIVPDGLGGWVKRKATLSVSE